MKRFLDAVGDCMEFCQIQLNYLDWTLQDAKGKVALLEEYNIPVWVMEPVRGGKLAKLGDEDEKMLKDARPDESIPAWAFRFIQSIPNVKMVLSGMSDLAQVEDNLKTFAELRRLSSEEENMLHAIAKQLIDKKTLTCTNCKYCVPECPRGLPIPKLLRIYNDAVLMPGASSVKASTISLPDGKHPADCIGCGACEQKCPQKIEISSVMEAFAAKLED
jgi:predicted aldo/keto reductase-like oxidoreductase